MKTMYVQLSTVTGAATLLGDPQTVRTCVEQYIRKCAIDMIDLYEVGDRDSLCEAIAADSDYFSDMQKFPDLEAIDNFLHDKLDWDNTVITVFS